MDKKDSKERADKATATIQSEFKKSSWKIEEERENLKPSTCSSFFQKLQKNSFIRFI